MLDNTRKVIILGSGPAGWSAALYAARAGLEPLVITGLDTGGQLMTTTDVDNWPGGFKESHGITGPELIQSFEEHARHFGTEVIYDHINEVDLSQRPFTLKGDAGSYITESLIVATGATAKYLGLPSEEEFKGRGVSACATCDGFFYKNQNVVVVGGGNTAIEEALYLSQIAAKVHLVHRRETFRAEKIIVDHLYKKVQEGKIELHLNRSLAEVLGDKSGVTGVQLVNNAQQKAEKIDVHGVFIAIGHSPNTEIFKDKLILDEAGFIITNKASLQATSTNIPGVFAAGDVQDPIYRQAITSAGAGCQAALDVQRFLETNAS